MPYDYTRDARMLAAGNARGLSSGDPDIRTVSPTAGAVTGSGPRFDFAATPMPLQLDAGLRAAVAANFQNGAAYAARLARVAASDLDGDLNANANRLGVNVADLVRMRRNRPGLIRRLFTRKG